MLAGWDRQVVLGGDRMKITRIIAITVIGVLLILGACASPATTTLAPAVTPSVAQATALASTKAPTPAPVATEPIAQNTSTTAPPPAAPPQTPAHANKMEPGVITYTGFKITPSTVKVGETTKVTVNVTNSGVAANFAVELKVDGKVFDEQTLQALTCKLDIDCDETKEVTFNVKMAAPGTYTITVGDAGGRLVVQ